MGVVFSNLDSAPRPTTRSQAIAREVAPHARGPARRHPPERDALRAGQGGLGDARDARARRPSRRKLLEETYKDFVRGGANLAPEQKERFRAINEELSVLGVTFGDNLLKETNAYRLVVEKKEDLAGLPRARRRGGGRRGEGGEARGQVGLHAPGARASGRSSTYADNRELRQQILTAYTTRGDHGDEHDNKAILARIAALRAERAAAARLPDATPTSSSTSNMAKTPDKVYELPEPALDAGARRWRRRRRRTCRR